MVLLISEESQTTLEEVPIKGDIIILNFKKITLIWFLLTWIIDDRNYKNLSKTPSPQLLEPSVLQSNLLKQKKQEILTKEKKEEPIEPQINILPKQEVKKGLVQEIDTVLDDKVQNI